MNSFLFHKIWKCVAIGVPWLPSVASAASGSTLSSIVGTLVGMINIAVLILVAASMALFFWGIALYIYKMGDSTDTHAQGRQFMMWGIIIFFVIGSLWGIVNLIATSIFTL